MGLNKTGRKQLLWWWSLPIKRYKNTDNYFVVGMFFWFFWRQSGFDERFLMIF
jgi:hypothetical protein